MLEYRSVSTVTLVVWKQYEFQSDLSGILRLVFCPNWSTSQDSCCLYYLCFQQVAGVSSCEDNYTAVLCNWNIRCCGLFLSPLFVMRKTAAVLFSQLSIWLTKNWKELGLAENKLKSVLLFPPALSMWALCIPIPRTIRTWKNFTVVLYSTYFLLMI